ncbi:uncharacterized protein C16orf96-like isoform X2 [Scleropages formosus]|uniref:uncharacterized protein C16orf96-like isoform X2 n=1 Tax=Scleropages formosus TaxID=113540 RepID=UPI000878FAD2|nr:uncharacterized protein C16orf96-like isoform X2 [Scleropages formosus]
MTRLISLVDLVNLSIGTPEAGWVNFGALHTLLHALLKHLNLQDATAELAEALEEHEPPGGQGDPPLQRCLKDEPRGFLHIEDKLRHIESQLTALERLPSGADLLARSSSSSSAVSDMWQLMQLRRKVEASEDGVSKSMALIQDLMKEISELQASTNSLQDEVRTLQEQLSQLNINEQLGKISYLEKCCHQVEGLPKAVAELQEKVSLYPDPGELSKFVTWEVLQNTLVNDAHRPQQDSQAPRASSRSPVLSCTVHGVDLYPETVDALRDVGQLNLRHTSLEGKVAQLEKGKVEQSQLQQLEDHLKDMVRKDIPENLLEQLNQLKVRVDGLVADKAKDSELMGDARGVVLQLEAACERLTNTTTHLLEEQSRKQEHIDHLYKSVEHLDEKKADKDLVEMKIDIKADKRALETKVSRMQFDTVTEQLSSMFQDLLSKVTGQEHDWHNVIEKISAEMEKKLNRIELDPLKKQLEDRWKAIRKQLQAHPLSVVDDAAGFRKQLVARFHCISCDRPLDMMTPGRHLVTVPSAPGLPPHKSNRPYSSYDVEQERQHFRSDRVSEMADYSFLPVPRSCGGSHTLTLSTRRSTRLHHLGEKQSLFGPTSQDEEVDIIGLDGQIYKGRVNSRALKNMESLQPSFISKEGSRRIREKLTQPRKQNDLLAKGRPGTRARPQSARTPCSQSAIFCAAQERPVSSMARLSHDTVSQPSSQVGTVNEVQQRLEIHLPVNGGGETGEKSS